MGERSQVTPAARTLDARTASAVLAVAVLAGTGAGGRPEVFVRPRLDGAGTLSVLLGDGRIDAGESRTPAAAAIFAALASAASEQVLCRAAAEAGGRAFALRVTVLQSSAGAPSSYNHPVNVAPAGADGMRRVSLAHPGSGAAIVAYRCRV